MLILYFIFGLVYTDIVGYIVHRLLHSGKIDFLYKLHMEHHITLYPPNDLVSTSYRQTPQKKILGISTEWALPISFIMFFTMVFMIGIGISVLSMFVFFAASVVYAMFAYSWLHEQFHLKFNTIILYTTTVSRLWKWFENAQHLHNIHHHNMKKNYGIGSYWLDKIFKTYKEY